LAKSLLLDVYGPVKIAEVSAIATKKTKQILHKTKLISGRKSGKKKISSVGQDDKTMKSLALSVKGQSRESEEKYRQIVEKSQDVIFTLNPEMEYLFVSPAFTNVLGYKSSDIIGRTFLSLIHPDDVKGTIESIQRTVRDGYISPNGIEYRMRHAAGDWHWHNGTGMVVHDKKGKVITLIGISRDITERKKLEQALRESEEKYWLIVENSRDIIFIFNLDEKLVYISPSIKKVLGYAPNDFLGRNFRSIVHPDDIPVVEKAIQRNLREGHLTADGIEIRVQNDVNEWRWLNILANQLRNKKGTLTNYVGLARDITDRKQAEELLKESEEKYRLIVENGIDIIFTLNDKGEFTYLSPSFSKVMGYPRENFLGKPFASLMHPDDLVNVVKAMQENVNRGYDLPRSIEYRVRNQSGEWRWHHSVGGATRDSSGKFIGFTCIAWDVTDIKMAEQEKKRIEEQAQIASRLAALGEMAAGIAHEINNPLTGVISLSQILLDTEKLPPEVRDDLQLIAESSQRVAGIVKRLLTFGRQTKLVETFADVNLLIDNTLKLRDYVLKTANIEVVTRFDPKLPAIFIDAGQLQQVFLNLVVNAEQAMKQAHGRGILTITTEKLENNIRIIFRDDGPGITKQNLGHLFEPFFTTKKAGEGTGLGLSLSRSIILEHKGQIHVESEFGHGAAFIIELPLTDAHLSEPEFSAPAVKLPHGITKTGSILVIDDEPVVRRTLSRILTKIGYSVDTIGNTEGALEKLASDKHYDVIFTDVRMPGMSGIEIFSYISDKLPVMKKKIIFITGDVMDTDIQSFMTKNNLPYVPKPFDIELLKDKIDMVRATGQSMKLEPVK
jgi:PAS domain S-box-containing protein